MKILGPSLIISVLEIHLSIKHYCLLSQLVTKMTCLLEVFGKYYGRFLFLTTSEGKAILFSVGTLKLRLYVKFQSCIKGQKCTSIKCYIQIDQPGISLSGGQLTSASQTLLSALLSFVTERKNRMTTLLFVLKKVTNFFLIFSLAHLAVGLKQIFKCLRFKMDESGLEFIQFYHLEVCPIMFLSRAISCHS